MTETLQLLIVSAAAAGALAAITRPIWRKSAATPGKPASGPACAKCGTGHEPHRP